MTGGLSERIAIDRRQGVADLSGGAAAAWVAVATVWAKVEARASGEDAAAEQRTALTRYEVTIRRRTDVNAGQRALWRGKALFIRGLRDNGPHEPYLTLNCDDGDPL
jgi:SPP1 family predicted phage head-tail adaptor